MDTSRSLVKTQALHALGNRPGTDHHHFLADRAQLRNLRRPLGNRGSIQPLAIVGDADQHFGASMPSDQSDTAGSRFSRGKACFGVFKAVIGSIAMLWGYFWSWLKALPRYDEPEFRSYLRSYQHACLRIGKRAATLRTESERACVWHANHAASNIDEASMKHTERAELLGLSFDAVAMETAVARCLELCRAPRSSHTVITANASHLCMMRRDPELALACRAGHLTVADGMSVVWALRALGQPVPERVAGVDLMARLLAAAGEHQLRVYFLGGKREVVTALVARSRARHPGLEIAGFRDGYFGVEDHPDIVIDENHVLPLRRAVTVRLIHLKFDLLRRHRRSGGERRRNQIYV